MPYSTISTSVCISFLQKSALPLRMQSSGRDFCLFISIHFLQSATDELADEARVRHRQPGFRAIVHIFLVVRGRFRKAGYSGESSSRSNFIFLKQPSSCFWYSRFLNYRRFPVTVDRAHRVFSGFHHLVCQGHIGF